MFTREKWKIFGNHLYAFSIETTTQSVAFIPAGEHAKDNARLIAAAPELLEACKAALKSMEDPPVQCTGEWETGLFCGLEDRDITDRYTACRHGYDMALEKVREWMLEMLEEAVAKAETN